MYNFPRTMRFARFLCVLAGLCFAFAFLTVPAFGASMSISPTNLNYGNVPVNSGGYYFATLKNTSSQTINVSWVAISGAFKFYGISYPMNLGVGQSVRIQVKFVPKTTGSFTGVLNVYAQNAARATLTLSGKASTDAPGAITVSPANFSFGNITVGTTASKTVTINANLAPITISAATTTNPEFTLSGLTLPRTIPAGQSISVGVNFKPASSGSTSAQFVLSSNAMNAPGVCIASGSGVATIQHTVALTWSPSTSNVVGYNVYRGTSSGGPYSKLNNSAIVTSSYSDTSVASGATYFYVTTAVNSSGTESTKSNEVRAAIPTP